MLALALLFTASTLAGKTYTTTGLSNEWDDPDAWTCSGGGCNNNALVPPTDLNNVDLVILHQIINTDNNPIRVRNGDSIIIKNGGSLILSSNLNLDAGGVVYINNGRLVIGPGVFNCNGTITAEKAFIIKDGNFVVNGSVNLLNSCIELVDGNFNNFGTVQGVGTVKTLSGNINNNGTWIDVQFCSSNNSSGVPLPENCDTVDAICNCILTNCDILPGYDPTTKVFDLIGSELTSLTGNPDDSASTDIYKTQGDSVFIDIIVLFEQRDAVELYLLDSFEISTLDYIDNGNNNLVITVLFPISELYKLNLQTTIINYARPSFPARTNSGLINTGGDIAQGSFLVRGGFNVNGAGIKVGVLSDSYGANGAGLNADTLNGDLPGSSQVTIVQDLPFGSDEGRAMMQIVHDVAPGADLFFRRGFISEGNFAKGITELDTAYHCDVIIDDIIYLTEPFFQGWNGSPGHR